jgi:two-component system, OmpR family, alkaline phosphatase synthesis response regulator PhoP
MTANKILVCDDEPHILHVVSAKLTNAGFDVLTAADGEEALLLAKQHHPALLITDYQMPVLSGLELCAKLRADPQLEDTPVIMLTARGFSLGQEDLRNTNVKRVLPKPFSPREVLQTVKTLLEGTPTGATTAPAAASSGILE